MTPQLIHRVVIHGIPGQISVLGNCSMRCSTSCIHAVVGILLQQPLALQKAGDAMCDRMRQWGQLLIRWRLHPAEPGR